MSEQNTPPFSELGLSEQILSAIDYEYPSPIQAESIPPLLEGRDLLGQAQTGTGKTAAFSLPLLSKIDLNQSKPQILVLTPTRELAIQVAEAMQAYAKNLPGFHILPIYGGQSIGIQLKQLKRNVHVIVGTPGRVIDHINRKTLKLDQLKTVVMDEADEMLRMGFVDDVETILKSTPAEKQVVLFSATMPAQIKKLTQRYLKDPVDVRIKTKTSTVTTITQRYWQGKTIHKLDALTRIFEAEPCDGTIIFVRTKSMTHELSDKLEARGYSTVALNGDIKQELREKTINQFRKGQIDIMVATDVVARGLDVERISHVINYDMPHDTESYVHRIGRTGRAGRKGTAILFIPPRGQRMLQTIERATNQKILPFELPTAETISTTRVTKFKEQIKQVMLQENLDFMEKVVTDFASEGDLSIEQIAASLAYIVQKDRPLSAKMLDIPTVTNDRSDRRDRDTSDRPPRRERSDRNDRNSRGDRDSRNDRSDRGDRAERKPRAPRENTNSGEPLPDMVTFRLEVGKDHGVEAKHIVGAIANEAGVESAFIRNLKIEGDYSTVELPDGMPKAIAKHLHKTWVQGQQLKLRQLTPKDRSSNNDSSSLESSADTSDAAPAPRKPSTPPSDGEAPAAPRKKKKKKSDEE
ncbi:DEAD/DEAH box helicase [Leucothrix arctica]|uniref:ATP-dependent RNA helicase DeaD n=1 Tax=Leucothrix arctica TaxID=1481894 RepID=A0A317CI05_9GAMM|nr:DEAD/DEAH box helicase [Leucothrix arctica]PWQ98009.1 ATP-dependent RNA helicase [Leucothrix arctica]